MTWQNQQNDCAPSEDPDQLGHPPSLISLSLIAVRMKKAWVLSYPNAHTAKTLIRFGRMPRLIWVFAGRTLIMLVLSCRGSYMYVLSPGFVRDWKAFMSALVTLLLSFRCILFNYIESFAGWGLGRCTSTLFMETNKLCLKKIPWWKLHHNVRKDVQNVAIWMSFSRNHCSS